MVSENDSVQGQQGSHNINPTQNKAKIDLYRLELVWYRWTWQTAIAVLVHQHKIQLRGLFPESLSLHFEIDLNRVLILS